MKKLFVICLLGCLLFLTLPFITVATQPNDIYITNAWVRPAGQPMSDMNMSPDATEEASMDMGDMDMPIDTFGVSATYMNIENAGDRAVSLIGGSSPVVEAIEIHEVSVVNEVMQMREVEGGIVIQPEEIVSLAPGGLHIMMINLYRPLLEGEAITLTLQFVVLDDAGEPTDETFEVLLGVPVLEVAPENGNDLVILNGWSRATAGAGTMDMNMQPDATEEPAMPGMIPPSAVYMTLLNLSADDEVLITVESPASSIVEIHETTVENDVMQMRPVESVVIPADGMVTFEPGGLHIMLPVLQWELLVGDAITLTLIFESGVEMTVAVPVLESLPMTDMGN